MCVAFYAVRYSIYSVTCGEIVKHLHHREIYSLVSSGISAVRDAVLGNAP